MSDQQLTAANRERRWVRREEGHERHLLDDIEDYGDQRASEARREALEEAERICKETPGMVTPRHCEAAIRALMDAD